MCLPGERGQQWLDRDPPGSLGLLQLVRRFQSCSGERCRGAHTWAQGSLPSGSVGSSESLSSLLPPGIWPCPVQKQRDQNYEGF